MLTFENAPKAAFYSKHFGMTVIPDSAFSKGGRDYVLMQRVSLCSRRETGCE
jgi:hypothetical protein